MANELFYWKNWNEIAHYFLKNENEQFIDFLTVIWLEFIRSQDHNYSLEELNYLILNLKEIGSEITDSRLMNIAYSYIDALEKLRFGLTSKTDTSVFRKDNFRVTVYFATATLKRIDELKTLSQEMLPAEAAAAD